MTPLLALEGLAPLLAQETSVSELRWHNLPAAWLIALVIVPAVLLLAWWGYHREKDVPLRSRLLLAGLRAGALLAFLLLFFGPYLEISRLRQVRSHLVVLVDSSDSMSTADRYVDEDLAALARASGLPESTLNERTRFELAQAVLTNPESKLLERYAEKYRVHVMTFGAQLTPVASTGDAAEPEEGIEAVPPADRLRKQIRSLEPGESSTRMGQAVVNVLDTFRLRDEAVAGVVVLSDGQSNAGSPEPVAAGRRAASQDVPVFAVGVGDPRSPKNVQVSNLRAKEVVLARDTTVFEFDVRALGFENRTAQIEMRRLDDAGEPTGASLPLDPASVRLEGGDDAQQVRVTHVFVRAGTYSLRIGIPRQDEERIESDNWVTHTIRVIDRKIKVLYAEAYPRWDFQFLSAALTRDHDTVRAHTLLMDADNDTPQKATRAPGWKPLELRDGFPDREALFQYDVVILGDLEPGELSRRRDESERILANLHEFVETGGGLILIAGAKLNNPGTYKGTPLEPLLPVVVDRASETLDRAIDSRTGFAVRLTPEGERSPLMLVTGEPESSKRLWEEEPAWRQYWAYPAMRAKALAHVLAVSGHPAHVNKFGPRPVIATMLYGRGRVLYVGVDELWRTRDRGRRRPLLLPLLRRGDPLPRDLQAARRQRALQDPDGPRPVRPRRHGAHLARRARRRLQALDRGQARRVAGDARRRGGRARDGRARGARLGP